MHVALGACLGGGSAVRVVCDGSCTMLLWSFVVSGSWWYRLIRSLELKEFECVVVDEEAGWVLPDELRALSIHVQGFKHECHHALHPCLSEVFVVDADQGFVPSRAGLRALGRPHVLPDDPAAHFGAVVVLAKEEGLYVGGVGVGESYKEEKGEGDDERKTPTDGINQRYNEEVLHFNLLSQMSLFNNQAGLSFA